MVMWIWWWCVNKLVIFAHISWWCVYDDDDEWISWWYLCTYDGDVWTSWWYLCTYHGDVYMMVMCAYDDNNKAWYDSNNNVGCKTRSVSAGSRRGTNQQSTAIRRAVRCSSDGGVPRCASCFRNMAASSKLTAARREEPHHGAYSKTYIKSARQVMNCKQRRERRMRGRGRGG